VSRCALRELSEPRLNSFASRSHHNTGQPARDLVQLSLNQQTALAALDSRTRRRLARPVDPE